MEYYHGFLLKWLVKHMIDNVNMSFVISRNNGFPLQEITLIPIQKPLLPFKLPQVRDVLADLDRPDIRPLLIPNSDIFYVKESFVECNPEFREISGPGLEFLKYPADDIDTLGRVALPDLTTYHSWTPGEYPYRGVRIICYLVLGINELDIHWQVLQHEIQCFDG